MELISDILTYRVGDIQVQTYLLAFISITAGFVLKSLMHRILKRLLGAADKSRFVYDEILIESALSPLRWFCVVAGVWGAVNILPIPNVYFDFDRFLNAMLRGVSIGLLLWFGLRLVDGLTKHWETIAEKTDNRLDDQIVPIVRSSTKVFLVLIGIILVLQNLGYSVASLIAGLGLGGAAIAFASKDTLSNLFGSLVIFLDRPFHVGDWIETSNIEGVVEEVGLRTTRVRTFSNSLVTVPNALFTTNTINNWSKMEKRRIKMNVGLTYGSTPQKMQEAVEAIRGILSGNDKFHQDFVVNFDNMGPSSLDIFIYCFTATTSWVEYLEIKQQFLLDIMEAMSQLGVEFAFPSQSLYLESMPKDLTAMTSERPK